ncbi:MAG: NAD(P)H-dependent oxidoreductase [Pseudomonadota bacterium]
MPAKKVLAFAASNSTKSINARLASYAAQLLQSEFDDTVEIETIHLADYDMPVFSPEREAAGIPDAAKDLYARLGAADGLIISFAEYNGCYTTAFKNVFDWCSRIKMRIYQDKPMLMMATSVGGRGGQNVLKIASEAAPFFGGHVTSTFNFGPFAEHFDDETESLKTPELLDELKQAIAAFAKGLESPPT